MGRASTIPTTIAALMRAIARLEPADVDGYRRFLAYSEGVYREGLSEARPCRLPRFQDR
jgi:hypothetical protein